MDLADETVGLKGLASPTPDAQPQLTAELSSSLTEAKPPVVWKVSDLMAGGSSGPYKTKYNAMMKSNKFYVDPLLVPDKWQQNFQYFLGPFNPAFVDAKLSYRDIAWGYRLEYNSNGILWRVSGAGIPHPDDFNNYIEQNRVIESTSSRTSAEVKSSSSTVMNTENNQVVLPKASTNNSESKQIVSDSVRINERDLGFVNSSKLESTGNFGEMVLKVARMQLGIPYVLGGDGISSTDCGKYTLDTYKKIGIDLGTRMADEQYDFCKNNGSVFTDFSRAKPGDLVFFHNTYGNWEPGTITHVGIYVGNGEMIHASGSKGVSYTNLNYEYWQSHFASFGRVR